MVKGNESNLTIKQRKFLLEYFKTGNGTKSAMKVYDTDDPNTAGVIASENLRKLKIENKTLMETRGLSVGKLIGVLLEGLETKVIKRTVKKGGTVVYRSMPDHSTRHRYLITAGKWLGLEGKSEKEDTFSILDRAREDGEQFIIPDEERSLSTY